MKKTLEFLSFLLYPWKFQTKQSFTHGNSAKWVLDPLENLRPKTKTPVETSHHFFLIIPEKFTSFLINPWKFHGLFLQYPWKLE